MLTAQSEPAPEARVLRGSGLNATVKDGGQTVRLDGRKIVMADQPADCLVWEETMRTDRKWMTVMSGLLASWLALAGAVEAQPAAWQPRQHQNWGYNAPDWTAEVPGWRRVEPGEHPRLVFRRSDLPAIRQRAQTPEGRVMVARLEQLLNDRFTLWHPAGHGMLYQLTGDRQHAEKAKQLCAEIIDQRRKDGRDDRYGFTNPGSGGAMRAGPAIAAMGLAYDLNYDAWDDEFRHKVANAILDNPFTSSIAARGPIMPSCNHFGAAVGGVGIGLLAIRNDPGVDAKRVEELLARIVKQARDEISIGYGDRGYYFEGHQCGRISSNTGLIPFLQAYRVAAGKDLVSGKDNARWLAAKWIYEFARDPDGKYTNAQRGMYCRNFPRGGMWSQVGDFALGFGICPPEYVPALKWVYNNQVEPGPNKTFDIIEYPHLAIYALANWPIAVPETNPQEQPQLFPRVLHDTGAGYFIFRNGWSADGSDIVVSVLMGTHPTHQNGRGMAAGGGVYVYGKGLGWRGNFARYRFPGMFHTSYPVYTKFEPDGSGVVSGLMYDIASRDTKRIKGVEVSAATTTPTSLAVDFSGRSGAACLVVMAGPQTGYHVDYWMPVVPAKINEVTGQDGYATKTTEVTLGGQRAFVMTLQKGDPPRVTQDGDRVRVGQRLLRYDGMKIVME
jgi:hypothetical protein